MRYQRTIEDIMTLQITDDLKATMSSEDNPTVTVQLENETEAVKLIAEFEDDSGDLCHEEGSIMGKYPEFHEFRP